MDSPFLHSSVSPQLDNNSIWIGYLPEVGSDHPREFTQRRSIFLTDTDPGARLSTK